MDFSIGELARQTGVKVPTIRYYEQIKLLPLPLRTAGQQRRYDAGYVSRLNFIRHARELGFTVEAIRELLAMSARPEYPCKEVDEIAQRHIADIDRRIEHLEILRSELQRAVTACRQENISDCQVLGTLSVPGHDHGKFP
ncbi:MAG: MerR family transcriptional regulator [Sneathiella sp.]|jgi:DNA-binding transcriptional MerR regulator|uniref:MerR family transcriptional regulator n=1 Tax=Sneathiella sp. TaxID=1964365 RepID=UPI000C622533|nr:helix-turn-helix domain-containing protein [Sneathiella sp.]MAL79121.1 MerR family transcriptional regulator [Sneathiella sp.]|tara:strand:- start:2264 stop:2683 length:420 start_codon:yes stop_codon:yes gene_type:complete